MPIVGKRSQNKSSELLRKGIRYCIAIWKKAWQDVNLLKIRFAMKYEENQIEERDDTFQLVHQVEDQAPDDTY